VRQTVLLRRWTHDRTAVVEYELSRTSRTTNTNIVRDNSYLTLEVLNILTELIFISFVFVDRLGCPRVFWAAPHTLTLTINHST